MSALEALAGSSYGPFDFRVSDAQAAAYVSATGDDPARWRDHAPPSFAGAVLFKVAPAFFADPDVAARSRLLIHAEQTFEWAAPWRIGARLSIVARIDRLRERRGTAFVTFVADVVDDRDRPVLHSQSLFLMSSDAPPGGAADEREEPPPEARGENALPKPAPLPEAGSALAPLLKSASRADLVRYAAASEDFNPVHWDHQRGVEVGVGGVISHGLLMAAWATQPAAASLGRPDPLARARFRFRRPLYPDTAATVTTLVANRAASSAALDAAVTSGKGDHVKASIEVRSDH